LTTPPPYNVRVHVLVFSDAFLSFEEILRWEDACVFLHLAEHRAVFFADVCDLSNNFNVSVCLRACAKYGATTQYESAKSEGKTFYAVGKK